MPVLQFDPSRKKGNRSSTGNGCVVEMRKKQLIQVYDENYTFTDKSQELHILFGRQHPEEPYNNGLPNELLHLGDFHGKAHQLEIIIPTDVSFRDIVAGYMEHFGIMMPLVITNEGLQYHQKVFERLKDRSPRNKYVGEVEHHLNHKHNIASNEFTLDALLQSNPVCWYALGYDETRDIAFEYIGSGDEEDEDTPPSLWNLSIYLHEFNEPLFMHALAEYSLVDIPDDLLPNVLAHAKLIERK